MLSMATDFRADSGCPEDDLRAIAEAGFSHIHWCHHWCTDFLYAPSEVEQIARWLDEFDLQLLDLHGSAGKEKHWTSPREYSRQAGVELVRNRIEMTARLGGDEVVMHLPDQPDDESGREAYWDRVRRTLDELEGPCSRLGVRLAIENSGGDNFPTLLRVFELYGPGYIGLCYDAGHGNVAGNGPDRLEAAAGRLVAIHLHDNDGAGDQHILPFMGTVDWERLAGIIATSAYDRCPTLEVSMGNSGYSDVAEFLRDARSAGERIAALMGR